LQVICLPVGPRCDLCDLAKIPRLCPSKRTVVPRSPSKAKKEEADALVKIEVPPAIVGGDIISGELLVEPAAGEAVEVRHIKEEAGPERDEVAISSLAW
jgi:hypothetical protein